MDDDDDNARAAAAKKGSPFLTTAQAAFYLGLSRLALEKMRRKNRGPRFRKHGRFVRYHIADLEEWSVTHRQSGTRDPGKQAPTLPPKDGDTDA